MSKASHSIVLYGAGSPLIVDYFETCLRANLDVAYCVQNVEGESFVEDRARLITPADLPDAATAYPTLIPLFTPGNRYFATEDARKRGFAIAPCLTDPTSVIASSTSIGEGSYINAGVSIGGAGRLGPGVLINRGATVGHHAQIAAYVSIGPGVAIAGQVSIGRGSVIATGAVILPKISIGSNAVIGAGAVVTQDVENNTLVAGNPARVLRTDIVGYNGLAVPADAS